MGYEEKIPLSKPLNFGGLDTYSTPLAIDDTSSPLLNNIDLHPLGSISKRKGFSDNDEGNLTYGLGEGLFHLNKPADSASFLYAVRGGKVFRRKYGADWTEMDITSTTVTAGATYQTAVARYLVDLNDSSTPSDLSDDTEVGEAIYIANGVDVPFVDWGGERGFTSDDTELRNMVFGVYGTDDGVTPPVANNDGIRGIPNGVDSGVYGDDDTPYEARDWEADPPEGFIFVGQGTTERLVAWGFDDEPSRIDYSELGVPWNFLKSDIHGSVIDEEFSITDSPLDGGFFHAARSNGDRVVAVRELFGYLVVFKERRTLIYTGGLGSDLNLAHTYPVGCISAGSIIEVGNDLMFWSEDGVHSLSAVQRHGDLAQSKIDRDIRGLTESLTKDTMTKIHGYHDQDNARVVWFVAENAASVNTSAFVFYYDIKPRWTRWTGVMCECVAAINANVNSASKAQIYIMLNDGSLGVMGGAITDAGEAISSFYTTKWFDIGGSELRKRILWMDLFAADSDSDILGISLAWDFAEDWNPVTEKLGSLGENVPGAWDTATWDTATWDTNTATIKRYQVEGTGYLMKLKISDDSVNSFRVDGWKPEIRRKGLR
jgi:hypothetical protein